MNPDQFIEKWRASTLKERSASQSHFNDLCKLLGVANPTDANLKGERYCFEHGASIKPQAAKVGQMYGCATTLAGNIRASVKT